MSSQMLFLIFLFFFNDTATTEIYTLSLHDALPISPASVLRISASDCCMSSSLRPVRSEEHTSELQSRGHLVCRLLLEKKKHFFNDEFGDVYSIIYSFTADGFTDR